MNHAEEQSMEMEALGAIFGDQFEQKSPNECTVHATPNADTVHLSCYLDFSFPAKYPECVPELTVRSAKGMSDAWSQELKDKLLTSAQDMLGAAMIFSLVEMARDWLTERNVAGVGEGSMYSQMIAKEQEKKRQLEQQQLEQAKKEEKAAGGKSSSSQGKKQDQGTQVTAENFNKWMQTYIKEEVASRAVIESASKLTGRQLFEKGTAKIQEEEVVAGDVEDFDRNLFMEEDVDPDLLDDDDDEEALDDDDEEEEIEPANKNAGSSSKKQ